MARLKISSEHLNMASEATRTRVGDGLAIVGGAAVSSALLGGAVGYRHAAGMSEDETMPHIGPMPGDAIVAIGGILGGLAMPGKFGKFTLGLGVGGESIFIGTAAQSFGAMMYDKMNSTTGAAGEPPQLQSKEGYRDAFGRWHPGKKPVKGGTGQEAEAQAVPKK